MQAKLLIPILAVVALCLFWAEPAWATTINDACKAAFGGPLTRILNFFTGPFAVAAAMAGVVFCGVALIFGAEMRDTVKSLITVVLVGCLFVGAANVVNFIWGKNQNVATQCTGVT